MLRHHEIDQRSEEWHELRNPRFTSSKVHNLLSVGKRPMTDEELEIHKKENPKSRVTTTECIGDSFYSYCFEVAENDVFGKAEEDEFDNFDVERGRQLEPIAFKSFKEQMAFDFIDVSTCGFFLINEHEGSSPDGLVGDFGVLEIKAPRRKKFFSIVRDDIDSIDKSWLIQIQHQLRVTGRSKGYLVLIYVNKGKPLIHVKEIDRDEEIQKLFEKRITEAIKVKEEYKQYLIEKWQQFQ